MTSIQYPRPFLKWAGGKTQLLDEIIKHVPRSFGTYHEPFLGGGALFFRLQPERAILSDINLTLVRTYAAVVSNVEELILKLGEKLESHLAQGRDYYNSERLRLNSTRSDVDAAATFIYLNRTCFNGLFRVNKSGDFNVPMGKYKSPRILDSVGLRRSSAALASAKILHGSFLDVESRVEPGDFVYFDPPYVSVTASSFNYTVNGFTFENQLELRDLALRLKAKGVFVLVSNSSAPLVRFLYESKFNVREVSARRAINCRGDGRVPVKEFLIW